jgi:hypothetical protein
MKTLTGAIMVVALAICGCSEKATATPNAKDEADNKARADALKKEMDTAPKVFVNRDIFKKNEPVPSAKPATTEKK